MKKDKDGVWVYSGNEIKVMKDKIEKLREEEK